MRFWHAAKSTPNARMAFGGRELRFPTISEFRRDSEIAPTGNVYNYFHISPYFLKNQLAFNRRTGPCAQMNACVAFSVDLAFFKRAVINRA